MLVKKHVILSQLYNLIKFYFYQSKKKLQIIVIFHIFAK